MKPELVLVSQLKPSNIAFTKSYLGEELDPEFKGSNMIKVNMNSSGHE